ncbi:14578_t:CDS:1, partial [Entrophospora sp. SA101]
MTDLALNKLQQSPDYGSVNYLKKNDQICHIHYMKYVEFNKYNKKLRSDKIYEEISKNNDNIKINVTENGVLLSKEDFGSLIEKIENLESTIEKKTNQIEEIENLIDVSNVYLTVQQQSEKSG